MTFAVEDLTNKPKTEFRKYSAPKNIEKIFQSLLIARLEPWRNGDAQKVEKYFIETVNKWKNLYLEK